MKIQSICCHGLQIKRGEDTTNLVTVLERAQDTAKTNSVATLVITHDTLDLQSLPQKLVFKEKRERQDGMLPDLEIDAYTKLASLQGRYIPRYYGEAILLLEDKSYKGIVLEFVDGYLLSELRVEETNTTHIAHSARTAIEEISKFGIVHCDPKPDNLILTKSNAVMVFDFDVCEIKADDKETTRINLSDLYEKLCDAGFVGWEDFDLNVFGKGGEER
ncbi:hypothetical protein FQN50_004057 [Emmonsiellopsis sp. PD_5]|nr:hypothetical protein FQN50_004057 [Emmonsiellopsis sp. PD_5]